MVLKSATRGGSIGACLLWCLGVGGNRLQRGGGAFSNSENWSSQKTLGHAVLMQCHNLFFLSVRKKSLQDGEDYSPFLGEWSRQLIVPLSNTWMSPGLCGRWCGLCMRSLAGVAATFGPQNDAAAPSLIRWSEKISLNPVIRKKNPPLSTTARSPLFFLSFFFSFFWKFPFPKKKLFSSSVSSPQNCLHSFPWVSFYHALNPPFQNQRDPFPWACSAPSRWLHLQGKITHQPGES